MTLKLTLSSLVNGEALQDGGTVTGEWRVVGPPAGFTAYDVLDALNEDLGFDSALRLEIQVTRRDGNSIDDECPAEGSFECDCSE